MGYGPPPTPDEWQDADGRRPWDPFSIVGFVLSVIPALPIGTILSIVGLARTSRGRRKGRGLAIGGLVLSLLWSAAIVGVIVLVFDRTVADRDGDGAITEAGKVRLSELRAGDCLKDLGTEGANEGEVFVLVDVRPCAEPHAAQVYAVFELPGGAYPGVDQAKLSSEQGCTERLDDAVGRRIGEGELALQFIYPRQSDWDSDRTVRCVISSTKGPLTETFPAAR